MSQIPTNGLVGYYPFNGNANDESGNGNNGAVNGAILTTDRCGRPDSAYYFNGIDNYISLPAVNLIGLNEYSYCLWMNPTIVPITVGGMPFSVGGSGNGICQALTFQQSTMLFAGSYNIGNNPILSYSQSNVMPINQWIYVVVTRDNNSVKLFIDGNLITPNSNSNTNGQDADYGTGTKNAIIGGRCDFSYFDFFTGDIDDIRIYDRVLTDNEILSLYTNNCNNFLQDSGIINGMESVCQGQSGVGYNVQNMDSIISYTWSYNGTGATIIGSSDSILIDFDNNATSGNLIVLGNKINGSGIEYAIFSIIVNPLPSDAGAIIGDETVCLNQNGVNYHTLPISNASNYKWDYSGTGATIIGNSDNIILNFAQNATNGNLIVSGNNSCGTGVSSPRFPITVSTCQVPLDNFNIPNSFSPNGDGINEAFIIRGLTENSKLLIFDRLGKKIYESDNYQNDWNGKNSQGNALDSDTYWYVLTLPGIPTEFKGFVYLKR
jgi:gliding motility-associated-like protein